MTTTTDDRLAGFTDDQREILLAAATEEAYNELVEQFTRENLEREQAALDAEDAAAEPDAAAELRAQIDAAHDANGTAAPPVIGNVDSAPTGNTTGNVVLGQDRDAAADLAGGGPAFPVAADDSGQLEAFPETLTGTAKLVGKMGGKTPTSSSLTLTGGKVDVEGAFSKGQELLLRVRARVYDVGEVDKIDGATGQTTDAARRHKARITGLAVIDDA